MDPQLLNYYEAIERVSVDMLKAARVGHWDEFVKLEGICVLLINQLKHAATVAASVNQPVADHAKSRIMQRILVNDAEIRWLADPWLAESDAGLNSNQPRNLH